MVIYEKIYDMLVSIVFGLRENVTNLFIYDNYDKIVGIFAIVLIAICVLLVVVFVYQVIRFFMNIILWRN